MSEEEKKKKKKKEDNLTETLGALNIKGEDKSNTHIPIKFTVDHNIYVTEKIIGTGSFGVVYKARTHENNIVAIKKVLQDRRYKNRELQIMRLLNHQNIVHLENSFLTEDGEKVFLNLVLEYVPENIDRVIRHYAKRQKLIPLILCKLYMYQICRSLAYIHSLGICHRDVKPQNVLLNTKTGVVKLCDFGSAKILVKEEPNVAYICSRHYRAPELIFGATDYTTAIDLWSMGCVFAEFLIGQPIFPGENSVDQLVEIIKVLGTPTKEQIKSMNRNYTDFRFPDIPTQPWRNIVGNHCPPEAIDLLEKLLAYTPSTRIRALEACAHPFFDELRNSPDGLLPNGCPYPPGLFDFTTQELANVPSELVLKLTSTLRHK